MPDAPQEHPVLIVELSLPTCQRIKGDHNGDLENCDPGTEALFCFFVKRHCLMPAYAQGRSRFEDRP